MDFFVGCHQPSDVKRIQEFNVRVMVSINRLLRRKSDFCTGTWMLDSGAFTNISKHGEHDLSVQEYAERADRWSYCGNLVSAVSQDWMCEPFVLEKTGSTVLQHQELTCERYLDIKAHARRAYIMPVLQGYSVENYTQHITMYGKALSYGQLVGVGSVCKRNTNIIIIREILTAIKNKRPDLRLHGFGLKTTTLADKACKKLLHSSDSMAWSFAARNKNGRQNDWREAVKFNERVYRAMRATSA